MIEFDPIPKRHLLSFRVRGPELAAIFAELMSSGSLPYGEVVRRFAPPPDPRNDELVREGLEMLRALELVWRTKSEEEDDMLYGVSDKIPKDVPFCPPALERLHLLSDNRRVFRLVHDLIVGKDLLFVDRHSLLVDLEDEHPQTEYAWNIEKIRTWKAIAEFCGLIRDVKPSEGDVLVSPTLDLVMHTLTAYLHNTDTTGRRQSRQVPVPGWLEFVEDKYFRCYTDRSSVHQGLAHALLSMQAGRKIGLKMLSDASSVSLSGKRASHIDLTASPASWEARRWLDS